MFWTVAPAILFDMWMNRIFPNMIIESKVLLHEIANAGTIFVTGQAAALSIVDVHRLTFPITNRAQPYIPII